MTQFDGRLALAHQVVDQVRERFGEQLLTPLIPRNVRLSEAPSHGLPITMYDSNSRGAVAYRQLAGNLDRRLNHDRASLLDSSPPPSSTTSPPPPPPPPP